MKTDEVEFIPVGVVGVEAGEDGIGAVPVPHVELAVLEIGVGSVSEVVLV